MSDVVMIWFGMPHGDFIKFIKHKNERCEA